MRLRILGFALLASLLIACEKETVDTGASSREYAGTVVYEDWSGGPEPDVQTFPGQVKLTAYDWDSLQLGTNSGVPGGAVNILLRLEHEEVPGVRVYSSGEYADHAEVELNGQLDSVFVTRRRNSWEVHWRWQFRAAYP